MKNAPICPWKTVPVLQTSHTCDWFLVVKQVQPQKCMPSVKSPVKDCRHPWTRHKINQYYFFHRSSRAHGLVWIHTKIPYFHCGTSPIPHNWIQTVVWQFQNDWHNMQMFHALSSVSLTLFFSSFSLILFFSSFSLTLLFSSWGFFIFLQLIFSIVS